MCVPICEELPTAIDNEAVGFEVVAAVGGEYFETCEQVQYSVSKFEVKGKGGLASERGTRVRFKNL